MTADDIKAWLKAEGRDYEWYAVQIGSSRGTVSQWLRKTNATKIPGPVLVLTDLLMKRDERGETIELSPGELLELQKLAAKSGKGLIEYVVDLLRGEIQADRKNRRQATYDTPPTVNPRLNDGGGE